MEQTEFQIKHMTDRLSHAKKHESISVTINTVALDDLLSAHEERGRQLAEARAREARLREALEYLVSDVQHPRYSFPGAKLDAPLQHWSHGLAQEGLNRCPRCVAEAALAASPAPAPSEEEARG